MVSARGYLQQNLIGQLRRKEPGDLGSNNSQLLYLRDFLTQITYQVKIEHICKSTLFGLHPFVAPA
jgi:hypothetical protein